jgi:hypothetical protein
MKKWFIGFLLIVVLVVASIYIFIPNKLEISQTAYIKVPPPAAYRFIANQSKWRHWWPEKNLEQVRGDTSKTAAFVHNEAEYSLSYKTTNVVEITVAIDTFKINTNILLIELDSDSTALHWEGVMNTGYNPFRKIQIYQRAKKIRQGIRDILYTLSLFLEKKENVYSLSVAQTRVTDTLLATSTMNTSLYPTMNQVYSLVKSIREYISSEEGKETNYPMLHVSTPDSGKFTAMVAIPVNKRIRDNAKFTFKRMVPGNILVAEVKGGVNNIEYALMQMENFVKDHQLKSPAIPFQSLVTDRLKNPDSTQWITRIYYPIL